MPLVEVGPGYVSPTSGAYQAPGAVAPATPILPTAPVLPTAPTMPQDVFLGGTPVTTTPMTANGTVTTKSFFSNLWDQFIGPLFKGVWGFISGLFGGGAASVPAT